jgi:N6-adenosine-specific RNA methylase IME4
VKREDAEEYTQALGQVVAGGWRQIALGQRLGVPKALGLSTDQWVKERLGGYIKLSVEERRNAVAELKAEGHSQREIAAITGVDEITTARDLGKSRGATNVATSPEQALEMSGLSDSPATNVASEPLDVLSGLAIDEQAREAAERESQREAMRAQRKTHQEKVREERVTTPLPDGKFSLIYADPPWRYEHVKTESRAIENQYPTMSLDEICALQVPAADDSVLFLWATSPKLAEAMRVIESWGFTYRTCAVWDKEQIGMGYYFRQQHELLLVAAKGQAPVPEPSTRMPSVFRSKRSAHSEKPTFIYGYLEAMYPEFGKSDRVELFTREEHPGWTQWSNEPHLVQAVS